MKVNVFIDFTKRSMFIVLIIIFSLNIISCQDQNQSGSWQLVIKEANSNAELYKIEVVSGSEFKLSYRHSVSGSMVYGTFKLTSQGLIQPLTTTYSSYGPGLPLDYVEDYIIENGVITVYHQEEPRQSIRLWVSAITEETITIDEIRYPLYSETENYRLVEVFLDQ